MWTAIILLTVWVSIMVFAVLLCGSNSSTDDCDYWYTLVTRHANGEELTEEELAELRTWLTSEVTYKGHKRGTN